MSNQERPLSFNEIISDPEERVERMHNDPNPIILLMDRLEDIGNVGSLFRLADAAGLAGVYGYKMKTDLQNIQLNRISRQTTEHIHFKNLETLEEVVELTQTYQPIAVEYTNQSIPYNQYQNSQPCMLIVGNERRGVSQELLDISQSSLHIPMLGKNSSMNVSMAAGIVVYHLLEIMDSI